MSYSNAETYDMFSLYFECFQSAAIAEPELVTRYPDRSHYTRKVFRRKAIRLRQTGSVRPISVAMRSISKISEDLGMSVPSLFRILREMNCIPIM